MMNFDTQRLASRYGVTDLRDHALLAEAAQLPCTEWQCVTELEGAAHQEGTRKALALMRGVLYRREEMMAQLN